MGQSLARAPSVVARRPKRGDGDVTHVMSHLLPSATIQFGQRSLSDGFGHPLIKALSVRCGGN